MTLSDFHNSLKSYIPETYELTAPVNVRRYVVWHIYGRHPLYGDNRNVMDVPKVQIDIFTDQYPDTLADDVTAALFLLGLSYSIQSEGYDHDYNAYRTILQLEVV